MGLPSPAYLDEMCTLYQGDALQLMPELSPASVQLIIADVPYWKQKLDYLGKRLDWDRQWPTREAYLSWLRQMAQEWRRVLAPNGSLYVFASPVMAAHVEVLLEDYFTVIQRITWQKPPFATKAEMFRKEDLHSFFPVTEAILFCEQHHEAGRNPIAEVISTARHQSGQRGTDVDIALGYVRTKDPTRGTELCRRWEEGSSIPSMLDYCRALRACGDVRSDEALRTEYEALRTEYEALRRPFSVTPSVPYTDVWSFSTVPAGPGKHAAEKPLALLRHIIEVSSRPGDLVLDPTCGSASTLDAARQCGRRSIGIELEAGSIALAEQRLAQQLLPWEMP